MTTDIPVNSEDLELFHFGVKGMKWGVRRKLKVAAEKKYSTKKKEAQEAIKRPVSSEAKAAAGSRKRIKAHGTDALSNKQLSELVTRMNLEQQYAALNQSGKSASVRRSGRKYVGDILKDVGHDLAGEALKYAATEGLKYAFKSTTGGNSGPVPTNAFRVAPKQIESMRRMVGR